MSAVDNFDKLIERLEFEAGVCTCSLSLEAAIALKELRGANEIIKAFPPVQLGDLLYEVDPELAISEVYQISASTGYRMGNIANGIYPPKWEIHCLIIDGHGKGGRVTYYEDEFGKIVFTTYGEAIKNQLLDEKGNT